MEKPAQNTLSEVKNTFLVFVDLLGKGATTYKYFDEVLKSQRLPMTVAITSVDALAAPKEEMTRHLSITVPTPPKESVLHSLRAISNWFSQVYTHDKSARRIIDGYFKEVRAPMTPAQFSANVVVQIGKVEQLAAK